MQENIPDENNSNESNEWRKEWKDMPEFVQNKQEPYAKIIFRFENEESLQDFARIIGQKLTNKTKSSWHPFKPHRSQLEFKWGEE